METIKLDALKIIQSPQPEKALAESFKASQSDLQSLRSFLQSSMDIRIVEVWNWKEAGEKFETLADWLEGIQQHSSCFYLIWGTYDDMVNPQAADQAEELINSQTP